jgi:hypothetical protein
VKQNTLLPQLSISTGQRFRIIIARDIDSKLEGEREEGACGDSKTKQKTPARRDKREKTTNVGSRLNAVEVSSLTGNNGKSNC